jgi:hypothetical protein
VAFSSSSKPLRVPGLSFIVACEPVALQIAVYDDWFLYHVIGLGTAAANSGVISPRCTIKRPARPHVKSLRGKKVGRPCGVIKVFVFRSKHASTVYPTSERN